MAPNGNPPHGHTTQSNPSFGDSLPATGDAVAFPTAGPPADGPPAAAHPPAGDANAPTAATYPPTGVANAPPDPVPHPEVPEYTLPIDHDAQALDSPGPHAPQVDSSLHFVPPWAWTQDTNTLGIFSTLAARGHIDTTAVQGHLPPSRVQTQAYTPLPLMTAGIPATRTSSMEGETDAQQRPPPPVGGLPSVHGQPCPILNPEEDLRYVGHGCPSGFTQPRHNDRSFQEDPAFQEGHPFQRNLVFRPAK